MPKMNKPPALVGTVVTPQQDVVVPVTKPGWQTTEFWIAAATTIVTLLTAVGVISPSDSQHVNELVQTVATGIAGVVAAGYALARVLLKSRVKASQALVLAEVQSRGPSAP